MSWRTRKAYLRSALHTCRSTRSLRLLNTNLLSVPSFGARSFIVAAPKIWNSLPLSILVPVRRHIKAHYCQHLPESGLTGCPLELFSTFITLTACMAKV